MPITTIIGCDCGCAGKITLGEGETPDAEEILEVTDANRVKSFFLTADCLRRWATKYVCPYKRPEPAEFIPLDAILPGTREN